MRGHGPAAARCLNLQQGLRSVTARSRRIDQGFAPSIYFALSIYSVPARLRTAGSMLTFLPASIRDPAAPRFYYHDHSHGSPRHHLPLPPAGRVRRAPHDVPAARQLRPAAGRLAASHHARAGPSALDPRPVRQLRRAGAVQDPRVGAAVREHDSRRPLSGQRAGFPDRAEGEDLPVRLRRRRDARPDGVDRARISRSRRRDRPLGAQVPAAGAADPDGKAADDAHLRHQGGLQLYAALRARHAGSGRRRCGWDAAAAATSRC